MEKNKIFRKRLKRKRIIQGRKICHGNVMHCKDVHSKEKPKEEVKPIVKVKEVKLSWFAKLINKIKGLWKSK